MPLPNKISLQLEDYQALVALSRTSKGPHDAIELERAIRRMDAENGIERDTLLLRWQEMDVPLPPTTRFPDVWPPELQALIERLRPISRADVESTLKKLARRPINVMVTRDTAGRVGWVALDSLR